MIVVADTSPINYLVLIEEINLLEKLYGQVIIPPAVRHELLNERTPLQVRDWIESPPSWLLVRELTNTLDASTADLDPGEREAIGLAKEISAERIVLDDLLARHEASRRGLQVIGTLGVLRDAARADFIDIYAAVAKLRATSFNGSAELFQSLLQEFER